MKDTLHDRAVSPVARTGAGIWMTGVLRIIAFTAPLLPIFAALGMVPLLLVSAAAVALLALVQRRAIGLPGWPVAPVLLGLVLVWGALSGLWSVRPNASLLTVLQLLGLFAPGMVLIGVIALLGDDEAASIGRALALGMIGAVAVYGIEIAFDSPIQALLQARGTSPEQIYSVFNRGLAVLVLLLAPAAIFLRRAGRHAAAGGLAVAIIAIVYLYYGSSVALALACGTLAAALSFVGRGLAIRLIGWTLALAVIAAPFVARDAITPRLIETVSREVQNLSIPHRLFIWNFVGERALERPLTGWGLEAARAMPGGKDKVTVHSRSCQPPSCGVVAERLPLHTHNMALQWWLELGLPGAALGATLLLWLFHRIARLAIDRTEAALLAGQLTAVSIIAGLGYGAWQSWWIATLILAMGLSLASLRSRRW